MGEVPVDRLCHYPLFTGLPIEAATLKQPPASSFIELRQIHGKKIHLVTSKTASLQEGDGMITQERGLTLMIKHADCQVAIVFDPISNSLGMAHAGWRGQALGIYKELIGEMQKAFGAQPKEMRVALSPSLGPTKSEFIHYKNELPEWMWAFEEETCHFNLWKIAEEEFRALGITEGNISLPSSCTFLDTRFHSYRRDKTSLRNITLAKLL